MIALNYLARNHRARLDELRDASARVIASGWYALDRETGCFEENFANYCGVGVARTPPEFMKEGDLLETEIAGIGVVRNPVGVY